MASWALPSGERWEQPIPVTFTEKVPLDKLFVKRRIDSLIARGWLYNDLRLTMQAEELSVRCGVPSAVTTMVGFQTKPKNYQKVLDAKAQGKKVSVGKLAMGGRQPSQPAKASHPASLPRFPIWL